MDISLPKAPLRHRKAWTLQCDEFFNKNKHVRHVHGGVTRGWFDGVRHDSGDPFEWGERMLKHYEDSRVAPQSKALIFSDSLDMPKVVRLYERFQGRCKLAFGVGTNLTNDLGYTPLQIVIKMVRCNGQPVAKLSDAPEKTMCDDAAYLAYLKQVFGVQ